MKQSIGIVIPFYNTPMWGQTSLWSLIRGVERYRDRFDFEILVVDNASNFGPRSYKKPFINALRPIAEGSPNVRIIENQSKVPFHGTALDLAVQELKTDLLLCWETDIMVTSDDWLDFLLDSLGDSWMTGYEWRADDGSTGWLTWYAMPNPGLYRMDILKEIHAEVRANQSPVHYWGEGYAQSKIMQATSSFGSDDPDVIGFDYGVFSEKRGFAETHPDCPDGKGVFARPNQCCYENGQWVFYRMMRDHRKLSHSFLPSTRKNDSINGVVYPQYSDFDGHLRHYWAGTRSWDFFTHPERNWSQISYVRPKIETEISLWRETVPEEYRKLVPDVFRSCRRDNIEIDNLRFIALEESAPPHLRAESQATADWYREFMSETDYDSLP